MPRTEDPAVQPISSSVGIDGAEDAGFTLLEAACAMALMALLAAILMPYLSSGTSRTRLQAYAVELAALLKADRNAARMRGSEVAATVDARNRLVRGGSGGRVIRIADDVKFQSVLPGRCNRRPAASSIRFFANGMSCGGILTLSRAGHRVDVQVNWLTGGVEIAERTTR